MKSTFLFCAKLRNFLSEIPLLILLILSIKYNGMVDNLLGLWPLIILLSGFMIFIIVFFCRFISISNEEVRMLGVFSSKEIREITEGKTLKLIQKKGKRIYVELWGIDKKPEFDWIDKNEESEIETNLFREKAVGGIGSIKKVLRFFGISKDEINLFFNTDSFEKEYENIYVSSSLEAGERHICIKFLTTL